MEHAFKQKVFYSDTDAYGVVWHGSYLRWLEMGRVLYCEARGAKLQELTAQNITLPVSKIDIQYKYSAKLDDELIVKTKISDYGKYYLTFSQVITDEKETKTYIKATVTVVAIDNSGKLYRSLPEPVLKICAQ